LYARYPSVGAPQLGTQLGQWKDEAYAEPMGE